MNAAPVAAVINSTPDIVDMLRIALEYAGFVVVSALTCSLAGQTFEVTLRDGSVAQRAYGSHDATERYYCSFGLNPEYVEPLERAGLVVSGVDTDGEPRIVELPGWRFFVGTLFVPQMASEPGAPHPLVRAFAHAAAGG